MGSSYEKIIWMKPKVIVLKSDGINCDEELVYAFTLAGGDVDLVHVNELRAGTKKLQDYKILAIPGGFSYGDDIVSGKILATELTSFFSKELIRFIKRADTQIIGICNGFQVLVRTGLLPFGNVGQMETTLTDNESGRFECRWVDLVVDPKTRSKALQNMRGRRVSYQVAHGEGKFFATDKVLKNMEKNNLVALRYTDADGKPTQDYPANPNGALHAIAGITDPTGRIIGMMPHPERFVTAEHHPNWRREKKNPEGLPIFANMVEVAKGEEKKYKKYALIGTSSTGKTTLLNKLFHEVKRKYGKKHVVVVPEVARLYFTIFKTNTPFAYEHQSKIQSLVKELETMALAIKPEIILSDRSVIDAAAYVHSTGDMKGAKKLLTNAKGWIQTYDHIFLLDPVGVSFTQDKIRKEDFKTRAKFHDSFVNILPQLTSKWTLITGTKKKRLQTMFDIIYTSHR